MKTCKFVRVVAGQPYLQRGLRVWDLPTEEVEPFNPITIADNISSWHDDAGDIELRDSEREILSRMWDDHVTADCEILYYMETNGYVISGYRPPEEGELYATRHANHIENILVRRAERDQDDQDWRDFTDNTLIFRRS